MKIPSQSVQAAMRRQSSTRNYSFSEQIDETPPSDCSARCAKYMRMHWSGQLHGDIDQARGTDHPRAFGGLRPPSTPSSASTGSSWPGCINTELSRLAPQDGIRENFTWRHQHEAEPGHDTGRAARWSDLILFYLRICRTGDIHAHGLYTHAPGN